MREGVKRNFILRQGFEEPAPAICPWQYSALHFQPRTVLLWVLAGVLLQSTPLFSALCAVLWSSALLSKLDSTDPAPSTIWVFTANDTERLERRFLSRCKVLEFSSYGMAGEITAYLDKVWHAEGGNGNCPDLARVVKESRNNLRDCLQTLEVELLAA